MNETGMWARRMYWFAILALPACFSSPNVPRDTVAAKQLASWSPIPGRTCKTRPPTALPQASILIDVAKLQDSLSASRYRGVRGRVVFSVVYVSTGLRHSEVVQTTLDDTTRAAITRIVDSLIRKNVDAPNARLLNWGWQLAVDLGEQVTLEVGHQELCYPALRSAPTAREQARAISRNATQPGYTDRDVVHVRIKVDERGRAEGEVIRASMTGRFDRAAPSIIASQAYWPMLVDRIPVAWEFEDRFP